MNYINQAIKFITNYWNQDCIYVRIKRLETEVYNLKKTKTC